MTSMPLSSFPVGSAVTHSVHDLADFVVHSRLAQAITARESRYRFQAHQVLAVRLRVQDVFDRWAADDTWRAYRGSRQQLILDADDAVADITAAQQPGYSSCGVLIYADSRDALERMQSCLVDRIVAERITAPMFSVVSHYQTGGRIASMATNEIATDDVYDEAYPDLVGGVTEFVARYLASDEPILVLQGPPGSGKTRLVRAVFGAMARAEGAGIDVMTASDAEVLERDELYVGFLSGGYQALFLEDADHLLRPRSDGNAVMHRFLTIADGVIRNHGRRILFTTNLPNVGDLDDALLRPGRCFARIVTRHLRLHEAEALLRRLCGDDPAELALQRLGAPPKHGWSVAELYRIARAARKP